MNSRVRDLELKVLSDMKQAVGQARKLGQALEIVLNSLSQRLSMTRGAITLKNRETGRLALRASHGLGAEDKKRGLCRLDDSAASRILGSVQPFVVTHINNEPVLAEKVGSERIERRQISFMGVPIALDGSPVGLFIVDRLFGDNIPWAEDIAFLTILADFAAELISINHRIKTRESKFMRAQVSLKRDFLEKCRDFFSIGRSPAMLEVQQLVRKVAPTKASVLLLGEPGTGKTLVARIIHELGGRAAGPFAKVNCAALAGESLESELLGHERGAFEGAMATKGGLVEEADGGTIFLNEVGELALPAQAKLLKLLQDREFERLGATRTRKADIRIITGADKDMAGAVAEGRFREDLYYRLNVFPIQLAPLRERREDIVALLKFFTEKVCHDYGSEVLFTPQGIEALTRYSWPGNVREMENLVERLAIVFGTGLIDADDLAPYMS